MFMVVTASISTNHKIDVYDGVPSVKKNVRGITISIHVYHIHGSCRLKVQFPEINNFNKTCSFCVIRLLKMLHQILTIN